MKSPAGLWYVMTVILGLARVKILAGFLSSGSGVGVLIFCVEILALFFGLLNVFVSKRKDFSWLGLVVPFGYLIGVYLVPKTLTFSSCGLVLVLVGVLVQVCALFQLQERFTFGGSSWVRLQDRGIYSVIRHPQSLARLLMLAGVFLSVPPLIQNYCFLVVLALVVVAVIVSEERFLMTQKEYVDYSKKVKFRLIPYLI